MQNKDMSHKCSCRAHLLYPCGKELFSRALVDNAVCECVCVCVCVCVFCNRTVHTQTQEKVQDRKEAQNFKTCKSIQIFFKLSFVIVVLNFLFKIINQQYKGIIWHQIPKNQFLKYYLGTSEVVQWLRLHLSMQGVQHQSLVRELRSQVPSGQKTRT